MICKPIRVSSKHIFSCIQDCETIPTLLFNPFTSLLQLVNLTFCTSLFKLYYDNFDKLESEFSFEIWHDNYWHKILFMKVLRIFLLKIFFYVLPPPQLSANITHFFFFFSVAKFTSLPTANLILPSLLKRFLFSKWFIIKGHSFNHLDKYSK